VFMTVLLLVYNVSSIIVFASQRHVIIYKLERFKKLLADPFPTCNCLFIIGESVQIAGSVGVGEMKQRIVMQVCKNPEKKCDIRDN